MSDMEIALGLENAQLRAQLAEARVALRLCKGKVQCDTLHHRHEDMHTGYGDCPAEERIELAIDAALSPTAPDEDS